MAELFYNLSQPHDMFIDKGFLPWIFVNGINFDFVT